MGARDLKACACTLLPFLVALSAGCHSNSRSELLEAELRTRELQVNNLRCELNRLEAYNDSLQREVHGIHGPVDPRFSPADSAQVLGLRSIALGRGTGGLDEDGRPGDEALQVLVEPKDTDGHTVKVPGTLFVQALGVTPEGLKQVQSSWEIPPDELRRTWKSGLLSTGYSLVLPWKTWPSTEKVRVVARLILADGRAFEAEKDITVRVNPAMAGAAVPGHGIPAMPAAPGGAAPAQVPMPREADGGVPSPAVTPLNPVPLPAPAPGGPALENPAPMPSPAAPATPGFPPPPKPLDPQVSGNFAQKGRSPGPKEASQEQPAVLWQESHKTPLSRSILLDTPVAVPQRVEWSR